MRRAIPAALAFLAPLCAAAGCAAGAARWTHVRDGAVHPLPPRPPLSASADTNDAFAYNFEGLRVLRARPDSASAAFFWASRLDPAWSEPLQSRALAVRASSGRPRAGANSSWAPDGRPDPRQAALADSLDRLAFARAPFARRTADVAMPVEILLYGRLPRDNADAAALALMAGQYDSAAARLGRLLAKRPDDPHARLLRAYALFQLAAYDSAAGDLARALHTVDSVESARVASATTTRAAMQYALGIVHVQRADTLAARQSFEAALVADLAFPMARVRRAGLLLAGGDTAAALEELRQEAEVRPDDALVQLMYGQVLGAARRYQEASGRLFAAIGLAPEYAAPYAEMGRLYDASGDARGALEWYDQYLARASRRDAGVAAVRARAERLRAAR